MEYVAFDLETTGFDPAWDHVIEVGAVAFTAERRVAQMQTLADPGRGIPPAILRLTGIQLADLSGAPAPDEVLRRLAGFLRDRIPIGHGATLDVDFLSAAGLWDPSLEVMDTLHLARILFPDAASHSLPLLAAELALDQPHPHRALDDAEATRQLFLRLREEAIALDEPLKEAILALVAPYSWAVARFFAEALTAATPRPPVRQVATAGPPPIRAGQGDVTDDPARLLGLLAPGGALSQSLPEYEHREPQLQMLLAVAQTFRRGGALLVEAGTGTGKSLAYLIPAVARALASGERVVVSTNTHTLQEQLTAHDIPTLQAWLPWTFRACLLKGRSSYLSLRRWRRYLGEPCGDAEELRFKLKILTWLNRTQTGDRSEVRMQGREEVLWARIASDPLDCVGVFCRSEDCYVHRARAEAEAADLVVVNHALLLADAAQGGGVLPAYQHLIVDEAHHLEDAATTSLREEVEGLGMVALLERLSASGSERKGLIEQVAAQPGLAATGSDSVQAGPLATQARVQVEELFAALTRLVEFRLQEATRRDESVRLTDAVRLDPRWGEVQRLGADTVTALTALDATLRAIVAIGRDWLGGEEPDPVLRELEVIRGRLANATRLLGEVMGDGNPNRVYWFTLAPKTSNVVVRSAPLNVGDLLREHVFGHLSTLIFTSASLAVGGTFDYFQHRVGLEREPETLILPSPFDYLHQALVCVPSGIPDPEAEGFENSLNEIVADITAHLGGRTLVLFTSHRQLRDTCFALKRRNDLDDVLILGQGVDGPRRQVLKTFTETDHAVLLGTASFWEGIDIPGDKLSCVIMVKLPFPVPSEPVFAARAELMRDSFRSYALPLAALRLKQGFGRLIRRHSDRGAVVLLDRRISSREYGQAFLEVLPPVSMFTGEYADLGVRIAAWVSPTAGLPN